MKSFATLFIIAACLLVQGVALAGQADPSQMFGSSVGLNVKFYQGEPMSDLSLLPELGVKWVRDAVTWSDIEPTAGNYVPFSAAYAQRLAFYKAHGIGVDYILCYANSAAYPATAANPLNPVNAPGFGRYAAHVAAMLKAFGVKFVLEIWNEPHNFDLEKIVGGQWNGAPPSPWVDQYCAMAAAAVDDVKAAYPDVALMSQDDMWIIHYWFLEKGLPKKLDAISVHPYWGASVGPEQTAVDALTSWCKPFQVVDSDSSLESAARRLRDQGAAKLGHVPAMWVTEEGQAIGDKAPESALNPNSRATADTIAANIPRTFITNVDAGFEVTCWFSSFDGPDGPMGLIQNDGTHRKSYDAFKTMTAQLSDTHLIAHTMGDDHRTQGVQAYLFRGAQGYKTVLWYIDGTATFTVNGTANAKLDAVDDLGQPVLIKHTTSGRPILELSQAPIYVNGLGASFSLAPLPNNEQVVPAAYLFR